MISTSFKKFVDPFNVWKELYETYLIFVPDEDENEDNANDV